MCDSKCGLFFIFGGVCGMLDLVMLLSDLCYDFRNNVLDLMLFAV